LDKPVALVSGGAQGIGAKCALRLAERGIHVFVVDVAVVEGESTCEQISRSGGSSTFIRQDLFTPAGPATAVDTVLGLTSGRLDIVVNNAFQYERGELLADMPAERFAEHLNRLVVSYQATVKAAHAPLARSDRGAIVNLASVRGIFAGGGFGSYSVAKAAVAQMTKVLATELGPEGIRVNAVAPGVIGTAKTMASSDHSRARIGQITPLGRIGTPDDVSGAITFLACDESSFITGQTLVVDGGLTLPLHIDSVNLALDFEATHGDAE
jgi:NAD(P)-dependent dehydrogenase (short-subunit alcohol dehydrogenase family)